MDPYSVNKLITNAFYISKVRSKDYQAVGGDDITVGLDLLNKVLMHHSANTKMIPYYSDITITSVVGQEKYFIENLVEPMSLTFNKDVVRYPVAKVGRQIYHTSGKVDNVYSLPYRCTFERTKGGCDLYVEQPPSEPFPFHIWGKFGFDQVSYGDLPADLTTVYDLWYIDYLENVLVKRICSYYGHPVDPEVQQVIDKVSANVNSMNYIDLTPVRHGQNQGSPIVNWMNVNLYKGYLPYR